MENMFVGYFSFWILATLGGVSVGNLITDEVRRSEALNDEYRRRIWDATTTALLRAPKMFLMNVDLLCSSQDGDPFWGSFLALIMPVVFAINFFM